MFILKKMTHHRTLFISVIVVFIAICIFFVCLFFYFHTNKVDIKNATLVFSYSEHSSSLVVDNSMPITDAVGKQLAFCSNQDKYAYSEFSISANMNGLNSINYEIYAIPVGVALELPSDYVKIYLTSGTSDLALEGYRENIPTYRDLKVSKMNPAGKKIYSGTLSNSEVKSFRLRMWLADTYPITMENRSFKILLYIKVMD